MGTAKIQRDSNTFGQGDPWRKNTIIIVIFVVVLRLVFSVLIDLLPEEAYYWNYARHLDIGYLDHPPMVAWLIWLSTSVFGNTEFAVRLPAFFCWLIVAFFIFRLTLNLFDKAAAYRSVLLVAALPIYFSIGYLMTPDAPLYAAWVGCLYFLERALIAQKRQAWWGVGICMGLGLLAKYTIGLLGLAVVAFLLLDRSSRRWLLRPEPYVAALVAAIFFSPVVVWNYNHHWASFVFQGPRRWSGGIDFSWHLLLGGAMVLLTPVGLYESVRVLFVRWRKKVAGALSIGPVSRHRLFFLMFTALPLLAFVIHSLRSQPKLNWTGPIWLAVMPAVAWNMSLHPEDSSCRWTRLVRKSWLPTIAVLLMFYSVGMSYIYLGMPGLPPQSGMPLPVAWEEFGEEVKKIESAVASETGSEPLIVGLDRYWISSELSFYADRDSSLLPEVGGRHIFGKGSLMWDLWLPPSAATGRDIIMIGFERSRLEAAALTTYFDRIDNISTQAVRKGSGVVSHFYWRVGYGYRL